MSSSRLRGYLGDTTQDALANVANGFLGPVVIRSELPLPDVVLAPFAPGSGAPAPAAGDSGSFAALVKFLRPEVETSLGVAAPFGRPTGAYKLQILGAAALGAAVITSVGKIPGVTSLLLWAGVGAIVAGEFRRRFAP